MAAAWVKGGHLQRPLSQAAAIIWYWGLKLVFDLSLDFRFLTFFPSSPINTHHFKTLYKITNIICISNVTYNPSLRLMIFVQYMGQKIVLNTTPWDYVSINLNTNRTYN